MLRIKCTSILVRSLEVAHRNCPETKKLVKLANICFNVLFVSTAFQAQLIDRNDTSAIVARTVNGPTFGFFSDLEISTKSTSTTQGFGCSYQAPEGYLYLKPKTLSLLAGSQDFTLSEVEGYYVYWHYAKNRRCSWYVQTPHFIHIKHTCDGTA